MENEEQKEHYVQYKFTADPGQSALRIDKFLVDRIEGVTRNRVQSAIDEGKVYVNGKTVKSNYKVRPLDDIKVIVFDEPKIYEVKPENIPLDVVYEDEDLMIINKVAGMAVHPGVGNYTGTLSNALAHYLGDDILKGNRHPYLVHRIDMNTSGLLLVAKNEDAMSFLSAQFRAHTTVRKYLALTWGTFQNREGTIEGNIARNPKNRMAFSVVGEGGKHATTHYTVLEEFVFTSLIECQLETGRTHQIRVHMKHFGHPLFNDEKYGGSRIRKGVVFAKYKSFVENCFKLLPRHALHAKSLGFIHPTSKEYVHFDSELPADFQNVLDKWRSVNEAYSFDSDHPDLQDRGTTNESDLAI